MQILYLAQHQSFSGDHAGFAHAFAFTSQLARAGNSVTLAVKEPPPGSVSPSVPSGMRVEFVNWELEYPLPFGPFPRIPKQLNILEPARALGWMKKIVRRDNIQIIQERHEMRLDMAPVSTRFLGIPSVLEVNSPFIEEGFDEGTFSFRSRNFFRRLGFDGASAIVVQTALLKKIIARHTRTPVHVVPNGADPALFTRSVDSSAIGKKLGLGNEVVGFAGAFHGWHGAPDLVEAFSVVSRYRPGARLLLIGGGGEDLEKCRALSKKLGIADRVTMTGKVPHSELPGYLNLCSVLVAPFAPSKDGKRRTVFEKYGLWWCPLKLFEYMSMGKPVVASDVGVISEYIRGAGLLYPEGDIGLLSDRITTLLDDCELREKLGGNGRKKVEQEYNWARVGRQTTEIYRKLLAP